MKTPVFNYPFVCFPFCVRLYMPFQKSENKCSFLVLSCKLYFSINSSGIKLLWIFIFLYSYYRLFIQKVLVSMKFYHAIISNITLLHYSCTVFNYISSVNKQGQIEVKGLISFSFSFFFYLLLSSIYFLYSPMLLFSVTGPYAMPKL